VTRQRWFVGITSQGERERFLSPDPPVTHTYSRVIGPFLTIRGATYAAKTSEDMTVREYERQAWREVLGME
jgi:hypothetical protein